jgi:hypothetical protein
MMCCLAIVHANIFREKLLFFFHLAASSLLAIAAHKKLTFCEIIKYLLVDWLLLLLHALQTSEKEIFAIFLYFNFFISLI